jgi:hypothetical protein
VYTCPECEELLNQGTEVCPYCGVDLTAPATLEQLAAPRKKRRPLRLVIVLGALIASVWAIVWFVLPPRPGTSKPEAEKSALAALTTIRSSLSAYAAATGGYPASLEPLGVAARTAAQSAQNAGYDIQYTPGAAAADGLIRNFSLVAKPGNYGFHNFYVDETGIIHATRENRVATASDPVLQ